MNTAIETRSQIEIAEEKVNEKLKCFSLEFQPLLKKLIKEECGNNPFSQSSGFIAFNHYIAKFAKVSFKHFSEEEINHIFINNDFERYELEHLRKIAIEQFSLDRRNYLKGYFYGIACLSHFSLLMDLGKTIFIEKATNCFIDYILMRNIEL